MESIISPWFFYLLGVINSLIGVVVVLAIFSGSGVVTYYRGLGANYGYEENTKAWKGGWGKKITLVWIVFILSLMIYILTPSKKTLISMYVADKVTYNLVEDVAKSGKELKNELKKDIIEIINSIDKEKVNE